MTRMSWSSRPSRAFVHERHRFWTLHVTPLQSREAKARHFNELRNGPVKMTTSGDFFPNGIQPVLPLPHALVGRKTVLDEQELAAGFENTPHFPERRRNVRNRAKSPGCHDSIDAGIL